MSRLVKVGEARFYKSKPAGSNKWAKSVEASLKGIESKVSGLYTMAIGVAVWKMIVRIHFYRWLKMWVREWVSLLSNVAKKQPNSEYK